MYVLVFYVPESHLEQVKKSLFRAGAGAIGDYTRCAWQVGGSGQFQPEEGSDPFIGSTGQVEQVKEYRVEIMCPADRAKDIAAALISAHPYEEPAYHFIPVLTAEDF